VRVGLDRDAVVHVVDPHDLRLAAVAAQLVVLTHDERFHRLGRADLGTQATEACTATD